MNENGLTWERWYAAATYGVPAGRKPTMLDDRFIEMRGDWQKGIDACEWPAILAGFVSVGA